MIESIGTLYAIQDLFDDLAQRAIHRDQFIAGFSRYGTSTAKDVFETATRLNWICIAEDGQMVPTNPGRDAHQGQDRAIRLRFQLANYIENFRPAWAALLPKGRKEAEVSLPKEILQCLEEALLFEEPTDEIIQWWDRLSGIMREEAQRRLMAIGREGERLSMRYEQERTGAAPQWKSIETNYAGYDVLSIQAHEDQRRLKIEVKASTRRFRDALLNITQHEWRTATASPEEYLFHFWLIEEEARTLYILPTHEIEPHIPANQGKGAWTVSNIPLGAVTHPSRAEEKAA